MNAILDVCYAASDDVVVFVNNIPDILCARMTAFSQANGTVKHILRGYLILAISAIKTKSAKL